MPVPNSNLLDEAFGLRWRLRRLLWLRRFLGCSCKNKNKKKKTIKKGGGLETLTMEFNSRGMIVIKKLIILNCNVIIIIITTIFF